MKERRPLSRSIDEEETSSRYLHKWGRLLISTPRSRTAGAEPPQDEEAFGLDLETAQTDLAMASREGLVEAQRPRAHSPGVLLPRNGRVRAVLKFIGIASVTISRTKTKRERKKTVGAEPPQDEEAFGLDLETAQSRPIPAMASREGLVETQRPRAHSPGVLLPRNGRARAVLKFI